MDLPCKAATDSSVEECSLFLLLAHPLSFTANSNSCPDFLPMLEKELLEVIRRYVEVDDDAINMSLDSEDNCSVLELNVTLPRSS